MNKPDLYILVLLMTVLMSTPVMADGNMSESECYGLLNQTIKSALESLNEMTDKFTSSQYSLTECEAARGAIKGERDVCLSQKSRMNDTENELTILKEKYENLTQEKISLQASKSSVSAQLTSVNVRLADAEKKSKNSGAYLFGAFIGGIIAVLGYNEYIAKPKTAKSPVDRYQIRRGPPPHREEIRQ